MKLGRGPVLGTTNRGAAGGVTVGVAGGAGGGAALATTGATGAEGLGAGGVTGTAEACTAGGCGGGGGGGATAGCCLLMIAFRTSPGFEIWDRSILVLISSGSGRAARALPPPLCWPPLSCARTFSASKSSRELECVFFSVTPTSGSTSRMALLLTSSSLARSLIRILLIRPLNPPPCPAKSSYQPHGVSCKYAGPHTNLLARLGGRRSIT